MSKNKKKKAIKAGTLRSLHSITFYIPNKRIEFFTEALKEVSKRLYSNSNKRTVSKYIRELIVEDFKKRGLLDENDTPNQKALDELKKES